MIWFSGIFVFFISVILLHKAGEQIIDSLNRISKTLGISKFTVSFIVMAIAASLPNLFIGITSALEGIPELSLGDIIGNNAIDLSLGIGIAVWFSTTRKIPSGSKLVKTTLIFTIAAAIIPLLLLSDGVLSAHDGLVLITLFVFYIFWLFSKKDHYKELVEQDETISFLDNLKGALVDIGKISLAIIILVLSAQGVVWSISLIAKMANIPIMFAGTVLVGISSALPEIYFAANCARRGETEMILGNLMGAIIIPSTLVLGIVVLISPITAFDQRLFELSRGFILIIALLLLIFAKTKNYICRKEGLVLSIVYLLFIIAIFLLETNIF